jgi:tRNA (Thr-GGU) A37 N-methylase
MTLLLQMIVGLTCDFASQQKVALDSIDSIDGIPVVDIQISVNDVK